MTNDSLCRMMFYVFVARMGHERRESKWGSEQGAEKSEEHKKLYDETTETHLHMIN